MQKKKPLSKARKKQLAVVGIAGGVLIIIVIAMMHFVESRKQEAQFEEAQTQVKEKVVTTDFTQPSSFISDQSLWHTTEGAKVANLEQQVEQLQEKLRQQEQIPSPGNSLGPDGLGAPNLGNQLPISGLENNGQLPPPPPGSVLPNQGMAGVAPPAGERRIRTLDLAEAANASPEDIISGGNDGGTIVRKSADFKKSEEWARVHGPRMNIEVISDGGDVVYAQNTRGKFRARDTYIPSGTFFRSVLLGGVDAPTGGEAQNASPHPVLMRVTDFAQLPNRFKYNFRECFITGVAYGDLSAERAYIRTQNLSCVGTDGRAIDMPIKGYVAGEDGKTGVRGTIVSKQGQMLANALLAGVLSGLGQGVSQSFNITTDTPLGQSTSVRGGDQYKAGVAQGIGSAADRLAQYYIKLADKVFPVVEVNAGRTVDVVLLQGVEIDTSDTK